MTASGEFSVCQFFPDGSCEYLKRSVGAKEAVETARDFTERPAAKAGFIRRIIITDGGDYGEGVTFPPRDGSGRFAAENPP